MIDYANLFSSSQQVDYGTDVRSTNIIDLVATGMQYGEQIPLFLNVEVTDANITALNVKIQTCATEGGSYTDIGESVISLGTSVPVGTYSLGSVNHTLLNRYVQLYYDVTGATSGHLHVTAGVILTPQSNKTQG